MSRMFELFIASVSLSLLCWLTGDVPVVGVAPYMFFALSVFFAFLLFWMLWSGLCSLFERLWRWLAFKRAEKRGEVFEWVCPECGEVKAL